MFKYVQDKKCNRNVCRKDSLRNRNGTDNAGGGSNKWSAKDDVQTFMGMPIWKKNPVKDEVPALGTAIGKPIFYMPYGARGAYFWGLLPFESIHSEYHF